MLSQVAQYAPMFEVIIEDATVDLRVTFDSTAKYRLSDSPTAFQNAIFKLNIHSPSSLDQVRALVEHAKMSCHASQSFSTPVPVSVSAFVNGEDIDIT